MSRPAELAARLVRWWAVMIVAPLVPVGAQDSEVESSQRPRRWAGKVSGAGNLFFGNVQQVTVSGRLALARADSVYALRFDGQTLYGEQQNDEGGREVKQRLWLATVSIDWLPYARWTPFASGTFESNFEKRIVGRYGGGLGAKRTLVRTEATEASVSFAMQYERTDPRVVPAAPSPAASPSAALARWSWRARVRHDFDDRVRASHVTYWRPSVTEPSRYTVLSTTEASYALTRRTTLSVSFVDNYDSDARARGARAYNDGHLLFGVATQF